MMWCVMLFWNLCDDVCGSGIWWTGGWGVLALYVHYIFGCCFTPILLWSSMFREQTVGWTWNNKLFKQKQNGWNRSGRDLNQHGLTKASMSAEWHSRRSPGPHDSCSFRHAASLAVLRHTFTVAQSLLDALTEKRWTSELHRWLQLKALVQKTNPKTCNAWSLKDDAPAGCRMAAQSLRHIHIGLRVTVRKFWYPSAWERNVNNESPGNFGVDRLANATLEQAT